MVLCKDPCRRCGDNDDDDDDDDDDETMGPVIGLVECWHGLSFGC